MSREHPQLRVRVPPEMKEHLEEAARLSGRTLTAEIVYRLQQSIDEEPVDGIHQINFKQVEDYRFGPPTTKLVEPLEALEQILAKAKKIVDDAMKERISTDGDNHE